MQPNNYYLLGQAVGHFDFVRPDKITPTCLSNLTRLPSKAAVILRHVWPELLAVPTCAEHVEKIDWMNFEASETASGSFWIGYYHARHALRLATAS